MLCFVVTGLDAGPGIESSGGSDVFVCEAALDTPAQETDVASTLTADLSCHTRTQHGRTALGVEASVVYNDWDKGIVLHVLFSLPFRIWCFVFSFFTGIMLSIS